jgi:hypothetical protein
MKITGKFVLAAGIPALASLAGAAVLGIDTFDYPNGPIAGQSGGTGWNAFGGVSSWTGPANVLNNTLISGANNGAFRDYGADQNESAIRATGQIFFRVDVTTGTDIPNYFGISSMDFGTERVFFGRTWESNFGLDGSGPAVATTVAPAANTTYTFVGVIDFENDQLAFFLNPGGLDFYNPSTGFTSTDVVREYTATNWSTGIRLQAGGGPEGSTVAWDNAIVGTSPLDVGLAIPEPSSMMLGATLAGLGLLRRRRN